MSTRLIVTETPETGTPTRRVYVPAVDHPDATHRRIDKVWTGCVWRPTGGEFVTLEVVEEPGQDDAVDAADRGP